MRAALVALALAVIAAIALARCALVPNVAGPSAADALADRAIADAASPEERKLRAVAVLAIVAELTADRVTSEDLDEAPAALARLQAFQTMAARLRADDSLWLETELYQVRAAIYWAVGGRLAAAVRLYLARAGVSLASLRSALRYSGKGAAMLTDIDRVFDGLATGAVTPAQLWSGIEQRLARNHARIEAALRVQ